MNDVAHGRSAGVTDEKTTKAGSQAAIYQDKIVRAFDRTRKDGLCERSQAEQRFVV